MCTPAASVTFVALHEAVRGHLSALAEWDSNDSSHGMVRKLETFGSNAVCARVQEGRDAAEVAACRSASAFALVTASARPRSCGDAATFGVTNKY